jgi:archaellin
MLWKVVSEEIKDDFKYDLIYNYNTNIKSLNNTIEELANKQKGYIKAQKYKIPVDKLPPNSQLKIEYNSSYYSRYNEIIILKVCNKIIKYMEEQYGYNTVEEQLNSLTIKRRQVKKQDLEEDLVNNIYKVKDYDSGKYYIYENGIVKLED